MKNVKRLKTKWKKIFLIAALSMSHAALASEEKKPSHWKVDVRADQQESIGYDLNVGYRLPQFNVPGSGMLFMVPGFYFDMGVGERAFARNTATHSDNRTARSWNFGFSTKLPVSEGLYLDQKARVVNLRLPDTSSQKHLRYLETSLGVGFGNAHGTFVEVGTNLRFMNKLDKPITVGSTVIQQTTMLYPSMSVGYRL